MQAKFKSLSTGSELHQGINYELKPQYALICVKCAAKLQPTNQPTSELIKKIAGTWHELSQNFHNIVPVNSAIKAFVM